MKFELGLEEARELLALIAVRLVDEAGLSADDRAALNRWLAGDMRPGSDGMRELTAKLNAEISRILQTKARSAVVRHDWQ